MSSASAGGDVAARKAEAARLADELARELLAVKETVKLSGEVIAGLVDHQQPWWAKLVSGRVRQPKVDELRSLLTALKVGDADVMRIVGIAVKLNACYVPHQPNAKGQRLTRDPEGVDQRVNELSRLFSAGFAASSITAAEAARRVGIGESWISRVKRGQLQQPNVEFCKAVAAVLGMSAADAARVAELAAELRRL